MLLGEAGTVCMNKVESVRRCKYYSEYFYEELILIFTYQKKLGLAIFGRDWPLLATLGLEDPVTD